MARKVGGKKCKAKVNQSDFKVIEKILRGISVPSSIELNDGYYLCPREVHIHMPGYTVVYLRQGSPS